MFVSSQRWLMISFSVKEREIPARFNWQIFSFSIVWKFKVDLRSYRMDDVASLQIVCRDASICVRVKIDLICCFHFSWWSFIFFLLSKKHKWSDLKIKSLFYSKFFCLTFDEKQNSLDEYHAELNMFLSITDDSEHELFTLIVSTFAVHNELKSIFSFPNRWCNKKDTSLFFFFRWHQMLKLI